MLHRHSTRPLLLLVAPAGFGKSTLAAAYARDAAGQTECDAAGEAGRNAAGSTECDSGAAVAWLTLHAGDRDSRVFFGRLREALLAAFEHAAHSESSAQALLPGFSRGLLQGAQGVGLARLLADDLAEAPAGFILVLDDYHAVQDAEEVHQSVDALVRALPEMGQVVITARETPPLSVTRLVAGGLVFALGTEDLRFTPEETAELRRALGGDPSLDGQAEGWVAGILLGGVPQQLGLAGGSLLGTYVEREVLVRLRPVEQRWLETLSVLEVIRPVAAERLLGAGPWGARLATLAERCPFLVAGEDGTYRLHALVREVLLNHLRRIATRATRAWGIARALAEEASDTVGVVRACQELGRAEDAVGRVQRAVDEAMHTGRWQAALAILELLPKTVRRAHPGLSLAEAYALLLSGRPEPARTAAKAALHHGGRSSDITVQVGAILELANIARWTGDLDGAEDWLSAADHLLVRANMPPGRRRLLEGRAMGLRGLCLAVRGQTVEARERLESAGRLLQLSGTSRALASVQQDLGTLCSRAGDYGAAQAALSAATSSWRLIGDRTALATTQVLLGNLYLRTGNLEAAGSALTGGLEAAREVGALRLEAHAFASLGEWHRANGRIADAAASFNASLDLSEEIAEREPLVEALRLRAELAIVQDDLQTARELLAHAQAQGQRLGSGFQLAGVERALGRLHLAEGAGQRAVHHLEAALERGDAALGPAERLVVLYWLGTAYLTLGRGARAEEALKEALTLTEDAGGATALAGPAAEDPRLLRYGLELGLDPPTLGEAERRAAMRQPWAGIAMQPPVPVKVVARNDLPRLEARLFGSFVLHRDGQLVEAGPRRSDRGRQLFALLALYPNGLSDREIAKRLWPAMAPQRALHNLQMAAYLLRRQIGSKAAVRFVAGTYQFAPQLDVWVDVRAFDAALARARTASGDAVAQALQRALDLYRGPLLANAGWGWVDELRTNYQSRFIDAALRLADLVALAEPDRSDALVEQVITLQPENEAAYERMIRNAEARRDPLAVRRIVRRYCEAVAQLGLPPNPLFLRAAQ
jgi:ATP/maltotriose-dependent transcriptional regulator MalT/DNA-binding SARP family transcriptional activator